MTLLPGRDRRAKRTSTHSVGCRHLSKADPVPGSIIPRAGSCALKPRSHHGRIWKRTYGRDKAGLAVSFMTST